MYYVAAKPSYTGEYTDIWLYVGVYVLCGCQAFIYWRVHKYLVVCRCICIMWLPSVHILESTQIFGCM